MKRLIVILLLLAGISLTAQDRSTKKKLRKLLKEAQFSFDGEDYSSAWQLYRRILALDAKNETSGVNAAISGFRLKYPVDSLLPLLHNLTVSELPDAGFYLAKIKHRQHQFDESLQLLEKYSATDVNKRLMTVAQVEQLQSACRNAKLFINNPHRSVIRNMGGNINSAYPDYVPVIVPDESALYFTSKRPSALHPAKNGDNTYFEDVYVSYMKHGSWNAAENLGHPVNSGTNDGCVAISPDGQRMIVYRTAADKTSGNLYMTQLGSNNRWQPLQLLGNAINSDYIESSACFSMDTSEIYFSSDRPGGFGGKDLYRVKKLPNGNWGMPYNLGRNVNTAQDEDAPFLHPDGVTLYFSSRGHNTMGDYDVFRSKLSDGQFSEPENLGYPINDVESDIFFVLNVDGKRGYYSSLKKESLGDLDIYQVDTRFGDNDLVVKHGRVTGGGAPVRARVTLTDIEANAVIGNYFSNPETGKLILITNPLKSYKAGIEADGYLPQEIEIVPSDPENTEREIKINLKKTGAQ
jgi:Tol biopolymer transport system component